jgi:hypothetical protein
MSFDLAIWDQAADASQLDFEVYEALCEDHVDSVKPSGLVLALRNRILRVHPDWADGVMLPAPHEPELHDRYISLNIPWSWADEESITQIKGWCAQLRLTVFDPQ